MSSDVWKTLQDNWKLYQKKYWNKVDDQYENLIQAGWPTSGLVDKRGKELVELKLQVLAQLKQVVVDDPKRKL